MDSHVPNCWINIAEPKKSKGIRTMNVLARPITPVAELTELRLRLHTNGYKPVPVAGINANVRSPGKQPTMEGWQETCLTASEQAIPS
jgi:hypothetical protein